MANETSERIKKLQNASRVGTKDACRATVCLRGLEVPMRRRLDVCRAVDLQAMLFSDRHKLSIGIVSTWSIR